MKNAVFWDVTPCRSCVNRRLEEGNASNFRVDKSASEEPALAGGCRCWFLARGFFYSDTSIYRSSIRRHISEDGILQCRSRYLLFSFTIIKYILLWLRKVEIFYYVCMISLTCQYCMKHSLPPLNGTI
jgi:hypothetical protein